MRRQLNKYGETVMTILKNVTVVKLREYSRSYGSPEIINVPYVFEKENEIDLVNSLGRITRTMRKGTKLLRTFSGTPITERSYKMAIKKALKLNEERIISEKLEREAAINKDIEKSEQLKKERAEKLQAKIDELKAAGVTDEVLIWKQTGCLHPAPKKVYEAKLLSGLGWRQFEQTI